MWKPFAILLSASVMWTPVNAQIEGEAIPGVILGVEDVNTPGGPSILHQGGLDYGVSGFHDRGGTQTWDDLPEELIGADYIESAQDNADVTDDRGTTMELEVEVADDTILHMFIDNGIAPARVPFPWMNEEEFGADWYDTGVDVGTGFSVWSTVEPLAGDVYVFRQQPVDASFYGIAATSVGDIAARECAELTLSSTEFNLRVRETVPLRVSCVDAGGDVFTPAGTTYESDREDVATVDENGVITAVAAGTAQITAANGALSATAEVTVLPSQILGVAKPGIIFSVTDVDTPGGPSILHEGGLEDGVSGFHDRDGTQTWDVLPLELLWADYIESAQNNADVSDAGGTTMELAVEVEDETILHMFIDNQLENLGLTPFPWMEEATFGADWFDTGEDIVTAFKPEGFSVWSTDAPLPEGIYTFRQQPAPASFYGIAATAHEQPSCVEEDDPFGEYQDTVLKSIDAFDTGDCKIDVLADGIDDTLDRITYVYELSGAETQGPIVKTEVPNHTFQIRRSGDFTVRVSVRDEDALVDPETGEPCPQSPDATDTIEVTVAGPCPGDGVGPFIRGDCDGNGVVGGSPTEAIVLLTFAFRGGPEPPCLAACDAEANGALGITDALRILRFAFLGQGMPDLPFPDCTMSDRETDVALGCATAAPGCK